MDTFFQNIRVFIHFHKTVGKEGGREIPKIRLIKSWKSWICDQYLPENMKCFLKISNTYKI